LRQQKPSHARQVTVVKLPTSEEHSAAKRQSKWSATFLSAFVCSTMLKADWDALCSGHFRISIGATFLDLWAC
jgi:hypothetical protein